MKTYYRICCALTFFFAVVDETDQIAQTLEASQSVAVIKNRLRLARNINVERRSMVIVELLKCCRSKAIAMIIFAIAAISFLSFCHLSVHVKKSNAMAT